MTAKDLIALLQTMPPDAEVNLDLSPEYGFVRLGAVRESDPPGMVVLEPES